MPENPEIRKKFQEALDALIENVKQDKTIIAAILGGSLVKGIVWEKSDIDLILITTDQKTPNRTIWLMDQDIRCHVDVMTRNYFIKMAQKALQGSSSHYVLTTSRILFSNDMTLDEFIEGMKKIGKRDLQLSMLNQVSTVILYLEKAEKYLYVIGDLTQSYLFITRLLDSLASITVMLNDTIPGREAVEQALEFEPELFKIIYSDVVANKLTKSRLKLILSEIRKYIVKNTQIIFEPVIEYLEKEATFRTVTDLARFLNDKIYNYWWETVAVLIGDWLAEQGYCERVECPVRLTLRSHNEVNEVGYYYTGSNK